LARLYYYSGTGTRTVQGTLDTTGLKNSPLLSTTHWYNYEIVTLNNGGITTIRVRVWIDTMKTKPTSPGIENDSAQNLSSGLVGLVSHTGTGYRYWGPIKVVSGVQSEGAYLAFEDFKEDTVVDVKPYTPANMHPVYMVNQFTTGTDTSGFVFDKSGGVPSLVYRHKPGTEYPVTCLVAPKTNLEWRDYEFSGKIIKPAGAVYDSAGVGVIFYAKDTKNYYSLRVKGKASDSSANANKFYLMSHFVRGGSEVDSVMASPFDTLFEGSKDTMNFSVRVKTRNYQDTIIDGEVSIDAVVWGGNGGVPDYNIYGKNVIDHLYTRKTDGYCGLIMDYSSTSLTSDNSGHGIKVNEIKIQKVGD
jgi:hypothetical protein